MATLLQNKLLDGQLSFERGVDTYAAPSRVPRNQCCLLINQTTRQDYLGQRPGWAQVAQRFVTGDGAAVQPDPALQAAFETGLFQGLHVYKPDNGPAHLIWSISGQLFRTNILDDLTVQRVSIPPNDLGNPSNRPQTWGTQAELFLVIQDGQSIPWIYDGAEARRSNVTGSGGTDADGTPLYEVPVGTRMCYSQGRLWVALPDNVSFTAGDGVRGPTGTAKYRLRDSVLRFTENTYLAEFGAFSVPSNIGGITAMIATAILDTSLGQGPMLVGTPSGMFSIDAPFDRTTWINTTNPIKTIALLDNGPLNQDGTLLVNSDTWYRSLVGVNSFLIARRDFGTWGNRAMSYEVIRHLKDDDRELLGYGSAALFDNRLLVTCSPQSVSGHGVVHRGLVVLDFIPLTSMQGTEPPCWDGLWTGLNILKIVSFESQGVQYCYAAVLADPDANGVRRIQLWQLTRTQPWDMAASGVRTRITRAMESPRLDFAPSASTRLEQKLLESAELWVDKVEGFVDFTLFYRPDEHPCWYFWRSWQICARTERCGPPDAKGCVTNLNLKAQNRPRMGVGRPPDSIVPFTGLPSRMGYAFQYRLEIVGACELTAVRLLAERVIESTFAGLVDSACVEVVCCDPAVFAGGPSTNTDSTPGTSGGQTGGNPGGNPPPGPPPAPPAGPLDPPVPNGPVTGPGPNLPPHNITPDLTLPPPTAPDSICGQVYYPTYLTNMPGDVFGDEHEMGISQLSDLQAGVMALWADAAWADFANWIAANGITVTAAQVQWVFAPSTGRRWNANQVFLDGFYFGAFGYDFTMAIIFCIPT